MNTISRAGKKPPFPFQAKPAPGAKPPKGKMPSGKQKSKTKKC